MSSLSAGRQIALLALCQALLYVNNVTLIAINGLADEALATLGVLYAWRARPATAGAPA